MLSSPAIKRELAQCPETLEFGLENGRLFADAEYPAAANCVGAICVAELVLFVVFFAVRVTCSHRFLKID
jgi:hypothetical protein